VAKERIRRKDLKAPDEFVTFAARVTAWVQERRQQATWIAAGLVALLAVAGISSAFRSARVRDANADLGRALGAIRVHDFSRATQQLRETADRWRPSLPGQIASALAPSTELRRREVDATIAAVQDALAATPDLPPYLHQQLHYVWAVALEEKGQPNEAAERYAAAAAMDGPYRGPAVLGEARIREQLGDAERAGELYRRYLEEFPDMPGRELIEPRLKSS
jgi:tetratricopeptide (TPR) repeat protein